MAASRVARAFALRGAGRVWIVESGRLDVFLARMEGDAPAGALTHVVRIEAGQAIFALPFDGESGFGFLAAPAAETAVYACSEEELEPAEAQRFAALWRAGIAGSVAGPATPETLTLAEFHAWAATELIRRCVLREQEEADRLSARMKADRKLMGAALRTLAQPLVSGGRVETSGALSPLTAACLAVGQAAGIEFKIPQAANRGHSAASAAEKTTPGTTKDELRVLCRRSSVRMRMLVLRDNWWKQDSGPLLAFLETEEAVEGNAARRPVALLPRAGRGYDMFNPETGAMARVNRQTAGTLNGSACVFYRPFPNRALSAADVLRSGLRDCGRDAWVIAAAGLVASLLALVTPFATGIVFDSIIPGSERGQLTQTVVLIVAAAVASIFISQTRGYALLRVEGKADFSIQAAVWDRLLNLPTTFFRDYSAGDLTHRSLAVSQIRAILSGTVVTAIVSGLFSVSSVGLLLYYSPRLALTAIGLSFTALAVTVAGGLLQLRPQRLLAQSSGRIAGMIFEFVDGIAKFKVSGTEGRAFARWAESFSAQKQLAASSRRIANFLSLFQSTFPVVALCLIFSGVAAPPDKSGPAMSTGSFLAFMAAFGQFLTSMLTLGTGVLALLRTAPLYARIKPIFRTLPESDSGKADPGPLSGGIEVNHLAFRYSPDTPLILKDVSFTIRPGEFVAFVGASGSGKSTLLRLLLGFETPAAGAVYYDGQDLAGLDVQEVRLQLGIVLQNGKLLPGDILTNIIGSAPLTVDDAWEAVRMAGLEADIKAMPMGMYTVVSEGGKGLSGGQRQRLMIARAIVRKPRILLFDEATSALDNRTQEIVSRAMEGMRATRIVIAHRLSTIEKADRIIVLDGGVVVQSGTYRELIEQEGFFAELAKRQLA
jgi:ATP-binding cassette subfamily C protein